MTIDAAFASRTPSRVNARVRMAMFTIAQGVVASGAAPAGTERAFRGVRPRLGPEVCVADAFRR